MTLTVSVNTNDIEPVPPFESLTVYVNVNDFPISDRRVVMLFTDRFPLVGSYTKAGTVTEEPSFVVTTTLDGPKTVATPSGSLSAKFPKTVPTLLTAAEMLMAPVDPVVTVPTAGETGRNTACGASLTSFARIVRV